MTPPLSPIFVDADGVLYFPYSGEINGVDYYGDFSWFEWSLEKIYWRS